MDKYILDTSCLTQAFRVYYPFDIALSFWQFIKTRILAGEFVIIDKVHDEICRGNDDLKTWLITEIPNSHILNCDANTMRYYASIMLWGNTLHSQYNYSAKTDFSEFDNADPFVVASALTNFASVVSQEISAPLSIKNIKLPDVCNQFSVTHLDTFKLLRAKGFTM